MAVRQKVIENNALQRKLEADLTQAFLAGKLDYERAQCRSV